MNLDKCYFRYIQNENKVDITFLMKIKETIRQFNFSRKSTDILENVGNRIGINVQKVLNKVNKKRGTEENIQIVVKFLNDKNIAIESKTSCLELFSWQDPVRLQIVDKTYNIVFNSPWILSVSLPQSILSGFTVYPENFITQYTNKDKNTFKWYSGAHLNDKGHEIIDIHKKWQLVSNGFTYTPSNDDIGMKLKLECIPGNDHSIGPAVEAISKNTVEAGPGKCPFESRQMFTTTKLQNDRFRCVSYNILADLYCDSDFTRTTLHPYCPPYALHIDYRKQLMTKELLGYNADIICLQEVDKKIYKNILTPILGCDGFDGVFFKKGNEVAEGLACFFRKERFRLLDQSRILLSEAVKSEVCLKSIWSAIKENKVLLERLLARSTVASATILQSNSDPKEILIVGNTHLYFHPDADHIRLIQGGILIYWLNDLLETMKKKNQDKRISLVVCGDFNSVPSCGIYQLYTTGLAPSTLPDWKSNLSEAVDNLTLKQGSILSSACGTPTYTNFTDGFADCLDYIFYNPTNLEVEQVVPFPSEEELRQLTALPSIVAPSDHLALIADLKFK